MRIQTAVLSGFLCLFAGAASAAISGISPTSIPYLSSGSSITINGTNLLGTQSTFVVFDGIYEVEPSGTSTQLTVFVPIDVTVFEGAHTLEVRSNDEAGTRTHGPVTFTVEPQGGGSGPPLLSLPEFLVAEAETPSGANVSFEATAAAASDGSPVPVTCTPASGSLFAMGTSIVQCSATDAGGTSNGGFAVFVTDTTPPVVTVPADIETDNPVVTFTASAVDNIDGAVSVNCSPASGSTFPSGRTTVRCTALDAHFNITTETFSVRVTGGPPLLTVPGDKFVEATGPAGAVVHFADEVFAEEANSVACAPASGSTFPLGNTTVTCTATNSAGSTSGSFLITVVDNTGPVLNLPTLVTAEATSPAGANATWVATAADAVDGSRPVDCGPASGSFFAFGTTTVTCTSTDTRGNETSGSFDVVVRDTTAPTITLAKATPDWIWPPLLQLVPVTLTVQGTDAVDPAPSFHIVSVTSNHPVWLPDFTSPDWIITSPLTLKVRAELSGILDRIYTIRVAATDLYGNVSTTDITVRVSLIKKPRWLH